MFDDGEADPGAVADPASLDDDALLAALDQAEWAIRRARAQFAAVTAEAARRDLPARDGLRSLRSWLAHRYRLTPADAAGRVRDAALVETPGFAAPMRGAALSDSQVDALARARANPRCGAELTDAAEVLVEQSQQLTGTQFRAAVAHWERLADTSGPEPDPEITHQRRCASWLQGPDGTWQLRARFAAAQGAALVEHLEAHLQTAFAEDRDQAGPDAPLARSGPQRRADVLADAIVRAADSHRSTGTECIVNIVVDHDTFTQHLRAALGLEPHGTVTGPARDRICRTTSGAELHPDDAVAAAIEGHVRRVVFDSAGVVVDLGRTRRLFTGAARRALDLSTEGCVWAGCHTPLRWCQGDHIQPWHRAGPTDQTNGGLLCARHNRMRNHGWSTRRDHTGQWHTIRPDGTTVDPVSTPFQPNRTSDAAA